MVIRIGVHQLYGRLPKRRPFFRALFAEMLGHIAQFGDCVAGVEDILTVYGSIICGFALPIKKEHIHFLRHSLLPLHKLDQLEVFLSALLRCLQLFIARDSSLALPVCYVDIICMTPKHLFNFILFLLNNLNIYK